MKVETREIYKCEYCNKLYQIKRYAVAHELSCHHNPDNQRACFSCSWLDKKETDYYFDTWDGEGHRKVNLFYCKKKDIFLYPPKSEHKENWYELGDKENNPMPKDCNDKTDVSFKIDESLTQ